jgi:hypothetical protein
LHKHIFHNIFNCLLKIYKIYLFMQLGLYLSKFKSCKVRWISVSSWTNRLKSSVMTLKYTEIKNYIHLKVTKVKGHDLSGPCIPCTKSIIWMNNDEILTVCISVRLHVNLYRWFRLKLLLMLELHFLDEFDFWLIRVSAQFPFNVSLKITENWSRYM